MTKNELEAQKISADAQKFGKKLDLAKYCLGCISVIACFWIMFSYTEKILYSRDANFVSAVAKVIESMHLGTILGYLLACFSTAGWALERSGKKRAIREKSKYQKRSEGIDRTSSGLNEDGSTPS